MKEKQRFIFHIEMYSLLVGILQVITLTIIISI